MNGLAGLLLSLGVLWLVLLAVAVGLAARRPRARASRWCRERPGDES